MPALILLLRIVVLACLVFFFMVLFQYGPSGLSEGFRAEAENLRRFLPSAAETDNLEDSPGTAAPSPTES
jgi:hypothetical protein